MTPEQDVLLRIWDALKAMDKKIDRIKALAEISHHQPPMKGEDHD